MSRRFGPFELGEERGSSNSIIAGRIGINPSHPNPLTSLLSEESASDEIPEHSAEQRQVSTDEKVIDFPFRQTEPKEIKVLHLQVPQARIANDDTRIDVHNMAPERNYGCPYYETCLSTAAALNWDSFSCSGCKGQVNKQLLWKAHGEVKKNSALQRLCRLPILQ